MLGIEESATRTATSRSRRLLVLDPARRNLGIDPLLLTPGEHVIGSAPDASIRLTASGVAARHCIVRVDGNHATVTAVDRRTWHNNGPFAEARLRNGDKLAIGPIEFRIGELTQSQETAEEPETPATRPASAPTRRAAEVHPSESVPAPQHAIALEAEIQERLLTASQMVDDLLREERGGEPAAALDPAGRNASPRDRGEFVLKLLDTLHQRASALVERERRVTAAQREFETERRQIQAERDSLVRKQSELTDAREALTRAQENLQHQRNSLESQHHRLESDTLNTSDRLREIEVALESLRAEEARFEESRSSHREAVLGLETELQERCSQCVETEKRLAAERAELDAELEKLDVERARCEAVRKELEQGDAQLEAVAIELEQRTNEFRRKSDELDAAAAEIERRTTNLDETERTLEERLTALVARDAELERREAELRQREAELAESTSEASRHASETLARELESIAQQREELGEIWALLDRGLRGLVDSRREVEALRIRLTEALHAADARSEQHAVEQKQFAEQHAEIEARKARLAAEQHRIEEREARLSESVDAAAPESHAVYREEIEHAWQWIQSETWRLIEEDRRLHREADRLRAEEDLASDRHVQHEQLEGALTRAEIELAGWESHLEDAVAGLDERQTQLESSEQALTHRVEEHERKTEAFNEAALLLARHEQIQQKQRLELERREAALHERHERLAASEAQAGEVSEYQAQLEERAAELEREWARVEEQRASLEQRLQECEERLALVDEREQQVASLTADREQLDERTVELDRFTAELEQQRVELEARVRESNERVSQLAEREQHAEAVVAEQARLEERAAELARESARLDDDRAALNRRIQECEERAAFVAEREQQAAELAAEQARLDERLAELGRESTRLADERTDLRTRLLEIEERESLLALREQDLATAREHFEADRAALLDERTRMATEAASIAVPHQPAPAPRTAHAFDAMPSFFPTPSLPVAANAALTSHGPEAEAARAIEESMAAAPHDETPASEQPAPAASEFRLLDLAWFSEKSGPRDEAAAAPAEEHDLDETSRLGQPCLRPDDGFGARPSSDDDRVAAFWRTTNERAASTGAEEYDEPLSNTPSEPADERTNDLRSALAAMFDLPADLAARRAAPEDQHHDEPAEESASLETEAHDAPAGDEPEAARDAVPSPIDFGRLLETPAAPERRPEPEVRREPEPIARPMTSEVRETRTERPTSHGSAVHDIEDSDSVAAYMERLFARTRRESEIREEIAKPAAPVGPEPVAPPPPRRSGTEIVVPAYVPGMEAPPEDPAEAPAEVDPVHRQDKNAVRARMDSLREVANISARSAIARHSWKQFRTVVWVKVMLLLGAAVMAVCLLSDRLFGKVGLKFAGWSLAGIAMVVAANLVHTVWTLYRAERTGEWPESEQPTAEGPPQAE